jgi:uncharacterized DUF497 family protein
MSSDNDPRPEGRIDSLLMACASNLEDGCNPLHTATLYKHGITLDECHTLAQQMAVAVRAYVRSTPEERLRAIAKSVTDDGSVRRMVLATMDESAAMRAAQKRLAEIKLPAKPKARK